jgi:putative transposase
MSTWPSRGVGVAQVPRRSLFVNRLGRVAVNLLRHARTVAALAGVATVDTFRPRSELVAENALLRQQIIVLRRAAPARLQLHGEDRVILVLLARLNSAWRDALHLVKPDTLLRWHRDLFKLLWRRKSRAKGRPKRLHGDIIKLIRVMAMANRLWGAERIRGELLKLGIRVSKRTVQKYVRGVRPTTDRGQTWETFLKNHTDDIWACDFLQLYDVWFRPIFAFFIVKHGSREVVHFNVTRSPGDEWVAQQLREATPWGEGPDPRQRLQVREQARSGGRRRQY